MSQLFDFDKSTQRHNTHSLKWDKYPSNITPLWVADMDFESAPSIIAAINERTEHGVFGYTRPNQDWNQVVAYYYQREHDWGIDPEWVVWVPGVVASMHLACIALSADHQQVLTPDIIYPHFHSTPTHWQKQCLHIPMTYAEGRLRIDFEKLNELPIESAKIMLFCNPQNPGGCVYTQEELQQLDTFCQTHGLILVSDEIHADLILDDDKKHIPYGKISDFAKDNSIVLGAASKTYNIAGLACSWAIIPNADIRQKFISAKGGIVSEITPFGYIATITALTSAAQWRSELLVYLKGNRDYLAQEFATIDGIDMLPLESTFLAWLDVSKLPVDNPYKLFLQAGIGLAAGDNYNDSRFMRLNFGCQRAVLEDSIQKMRSAVASLAE